MTPEQIRLRDSARRIAIDDVAEILRSRLDSRPAGFTQAMLEHEINTLLDKRLAELAKPAQSETEKRYAANPDAWMAEARAKLDQVEKELRSSSRSMNGEGTTDLQSISVRSI
jgi:hypothetical protein